MTEALAGGIAFKSVSSSLDMLFLRLLSCSTLTPADNRCDAARSNKFSTVISLFILLTMSLTATATSPACVLFNQASSGVLAERSAVAGSQGVLLFKCLNNV